MNKTNKFIVLILISTGITLSGCSTKPQSNGYNSSAVDNVAARKSDATPIANQAAQSSVEVLQKEIPLTVTSPIEGSTVATEKVAVKGTTSANAEVFVNETELKANAKGEFSTTITLDEGDNIISIVANDEDGNSSEQEVTVTYEAE
jgi:hypothetical protein